MSIKENENQKLATILLYPKFRCTAQNTYSYSRPLRTFSCSLEVITASEFPLKSGLLPWMPQNQKIEIKTGEILELICVAYSEDVRWTFRHRNGNQSMNINNTSSTLIYRNVSYLAHDGFYNCSTTTDFQVNFLHQFNEKLEYFTKYLYFVFS